MKQLITNLIVTLGVVTAGLMLAVPATQVAAAGAKNNTNNSGSNGNSSDSSGSSGSGGSSAKADVCSGIAMTGGSCNGGDSTLTSTIGKIINILSALVGFVAVVMIIVGGFKYITSGGDANGITSAKHTIIYAIVGLVLVAMAQVIVRFVLNATPK